MGKTPKPPIYPDGAANWMPPEEPVNGTTVTGDSLSGAEPKDKTVTAETNATLLKDKVTNVVAEARPVWPC